MFIKERIGKAALAKTNTTVLQVEGIYENDRQKFNSLTQDYGVTFDSNNNIVYNGLKVAVNMNTDDIKLLISKINNIAALLGITFDVNGNIVTEEYTTHVHNYIDSTINDTEDGTGVQTDTEKTTGGIT